LDQGIYDTLVWAGGRHVRRWAIAIAVSEQCGGRPSNAPMALAPNTRTSRPCRLFRWPSFAW